MKAVQLLIFASAVSSIAFAAAPLAAQNASGMRDVVSHDQLSRKLRMEQQKDQLADLGPAMGQSDKDPSASLASRDFVKNSAVFSFRGHLTLVPKRSVLHVPDALLNRMKVEENAKVQTFQDFLLSNRGWIRAVEVTREQALGHAALPESTVESFANSSQVVVATYRGGPISVLPLKDPEEVPTPAEMKPVRFAQ